MAFIPNYPYNLVSACGNYRIYENVLYEGREMNIASFPNEISVQLEDENLTAGDMLSGRLHITTVSIWNIQKITPEMRIALDKQDADRRLEWERQSQLAWKKIEAARNMSFIKIIFHKLGNLIKMLLSLPPMA